MNNKINYKIDNCTTDLDTLIALDKRAIRDLENNTHEIEQHEVLTIIREFIRLRNDYKQEKEKNKDLEEKLKIATAMLTKGTYPEKNKSDNDFNKQFIAVDKIKEKIENLSISLNDIENSLGMTANKYDTIKELNIKIDVLEELLEEV